MQKRENQRGIRSTFWMKVENTEYFEDVTIYTLEVPVKEHKRPEVIEGKGKRDRKHGKIGRI